nr:GNAT family N-acetyltransferase [Pseudopedobacter sp.]
MIHINKLPSNSLPDIILDAFTVQDLPAIQLLQPEGWGDILPGMRFYLNNDYCFKVKASCNNKIVGTGIAIIHHNLAWISGIIVQPDFRNKGIGFAITNHLIKKLNGKCSSFLLVATKLGKPVYERLNFVNDGEYLFFTKGKINVPLSDYIISYKEQYKNDIFRLDLLVTGEQRKHLLEPLLKKAFLYIENNKLTGYLLAGFGEGLIIAENPVAGTELMKLNLLEEKTPVVHEENKTAIDFLLLHGFSIDYSRVASRMYCGKKINWNPQCVFSRMGGNLG